MSRRDDHKKPPAIPLGQHRRPLSDAEARFRALAERGRGQTARGLELLDKAIGNGVSD